MIEPALRLLIVDDEPPARSRLVRLLAAETGVQVVGEAGDGAQALALADTLRPDALLLDVQMPEIGGLDVAASLPARSAGGPAVVFVTAFDQFALQAFDAAAVDYLLKPVEPERLRRALQRVRDVRASTPSSSSPSPLPPSRLLLPERHGVAVLACTDISHLQAADNYVQVHSGTRHWLLRRPLAALLADLGPTFVRIHRGHAVALAAVAEVRPDAKGDATVRLVDGSELPCSRAHRPALLAALARR
jgi:two-component system, LytTR family, response regulator